MWILKDFFELVGGLNVINKFNEPCIVTTSTFTKKTVGNDKLIQYTFEVEKSFPIKSQGA